MKKFVKVLGVVFTVMMLACIFVGCGSESYALADDNYANNYISPEKPSVSIDGWSTAQPEPESLIVNLARENENLNRTYTVNAGVGTIVFEGNPSATYTNFRIVVVARYTDLTIELNNFKFVAPIGYYAIDAMDVVSDVCISIIATGTCSIQGGAGRDGQNGTSYSPYIGATNPKSGENGTNGQNGWSGIIGNNILLSTDSKSILTIIGGAGGIGGQGGDGDGGAAKGIGQCGHGGNGGQGGFGGDAVTVFAKLTVTNSGILRCYGGDGGVGGAGGRGGDNQNTGVFDRADHGGNGGSAGCGGRGGFGIYVADFAETVLDDSKVEVRGGNGGDGSNGGDGGSSCKNEFQTSEGGRPGNAGDGSNGGNGSASTYNVAHDTWSQVHGLGGFGGVAGQPGYAPKLGYGISGKDGVTGNNGVY